MWHILLLYPKIESGEYSVKWHHLTQITVTPVKLVRRETSLQHKKTSSTSLSVIRSVYELKVEKNSGSLVVLAPTKGSDTQSNQQASKCKPQELNGLAWSKEGHREGGVMVEGTREVERRHMLKMEKEKRGHEQEDLTRWE